MKLGANMILLAAISDPAEVYSSPQKLQSLFFDLYPMITQPLFHHFRANLALQE